MVSAAQSSPSAPCPCDPPYLSGAAANADDQQLNKGRAAAAPACEGRRQRQRQRRRQRWAAVTRLVRAGCLACSVTQLLQRSCSTARQQAAAAGLRGGLTNYARGGLDLATTTLSECDRAWMGCGRADWSLRLCMESPAVVPLTLQRVYVTSVPLYHSPFS